MTKRQFHLHDGGKGSALAVRIIPRSSRNEVAEILHDGTVKIRLTSSVDNPKLNQHLLDFLAGVLQIPADRMDVVAGERGLDKLVSILNLDTTTVHDRIIDEIG